MKGILFRNWKIKAIADSPLDREWQTRRIGGLEEINKEPDAWCIAGYKDGVWGFGNLHCENDVLAKPRYQVGETVYIKEAYSSYPLYYKLDGYELKIGEGLWHNPMFMSARDARYFIKITDVRAERTKDITPEDCFAEGIERHTDRGNNIFWYEKVGDYHGDTQAITPQEAYFNLYDSINGKDAHKTNWDWVYSFKRVEK